MWHMPSSIALLKNVCAKTWRWLPCRSMSSAQISRSGSVFCSFRSVRKGFAESRIHGFLKLVESERGSYPGDVAPVRFLLVLGKKFLLHFPHRLGAAVDRTQHSGALLHRDGGRRKFARVTRLRRRDVEL